MNGISNPPRTESTEFDFGGSKVQIKGYEGDYIFEVIKSGHRFYEDDLLEFLAYLNLGKSCIVDVGANIGNHTINFGLTHTDSDIVAVEPFSGNLRLLRQNIASNGLSGRVTVIEAAAGDANDPLEILDVNPENYGATSVQATGENIGNILVQQVRLDEIPEATTVGLLKIDVEGFEPNVIRGADRLIREQRPVIITEAHSPIAYRALSRLLSVHEYVPIAIRGRSANFVWVSIGETVSANQFSQLCKLADILEKRDFRRLALKRLSRIGDDVHVINDHL